MQLQDLPTGHPAKRPHVSNTTMAIHKMRQKGLHALCCKCLQADTWDLECYFARRCCVLQGEVGCRVDPKSLAKWGLAGEVVSPKKTLHWWIRSEETLAWFLPAALVFLFKNGFVW